MYGEKITRRKSIVGIYCTLTRGASPNQHWTVHFMGEEMAKFETRAGAEHYAAECLYEGIKEFFKSGGIL